MGQGHLGLALLHHAMEAHVHLSQDAHQEGALHQTFATLKAKAYQGLQPHQIRTNPRPDFGRETLDLDFGWGACRVTLWSDRSNGTYDLEILWTALPSTAHERLAAARELARVWGHAP